jgi:hypothetical protein
MRLLAQQTCRGPAPKLIPKDCGLNRSLWVRLCLGVPPLIRAGAVRRPVHRPGTGGPFPPSQLGHPGKKRNCGQTKLAPPTSGASPPDSCSLGQQTSLYTAQRPKGGTCQTNPIGPCAKPSAPFRTMIRRSGRGAWAKPAPSRLNGRLRQHGRTRARP